jgi:hypothetical protein
VLRSPTKRQREKSQADKLAREREKINTGDADYVIPNPSKSNGASSPGGSQGYNGASGNPSSGGPAGGSGGGGFWSAVKSFFGIK